MVDWNGGVGTFATKRLKGLIFTRMNFLKTKVNEHLEMVSPPPMRVCNLSLGIINNDTVRRI